MLLLVWDLVGKNEIVAACMILFQHKNAFQHHIHHRSHFRNRRTLPIELQNIHFHYSKLFHSFLCRLHPDSIPDFLTRKTVHLAIAIDNFTLITLYYFLAAIKFSIIKTFLWVMNNSICGKNWDTSFHLSWRTKFGTLRHTFCESII